MLARDDDDEEEEEVRNMLALLRYRYDAAGQKGGGGTHSQKYSL